MAAQIDRHDRVAVGHQLFYGTVWLSISQFATIVKVETSRILGLERMEGKARQRDVTVAAQRMFLNVVAVSLKPAKVLKFR